MLALVGLSFTSGKKSLFSWKSVVRSYHWFPRIYRAFCCNTVTPIVNFHSGPSSMEYSYFYWSKLVQVCNEDYTSSSDFVPQARFFFPLYQLSSLICNRYDCTALFSTNHPLVSRISQLISLLSLCAHLTVTGTFQDKVRLILLPR